jgi:hypothetical protein
MHNVWEERRHVCLTDLGLVAGHLEPHPDLNIRQGALQLALLRILAQPSARRHKEGEEREERVSLKKTKVDGRTHCGNDTVGPEFGPPYACIAPYRYDAGVTKERTAWSGIRAQCCSGLDAHQSAPHERRHGRRSAHPWIMASTRSPSEIADAALSMRESCFNTFSGPSRFRIFAGEPFR